MHEWDEIPLTLTQQLTLTQELTLTQQLTLTLTLQSCRPGSIPHDLHARFTTDRRIARDQGIVQHGGSRRDEPVTTFRYRVEAVRPEGYLCRQISYEEAA
jgi:hypothetical protein